MNDPVHLAVVIPCFNEAEGIADVIGHIPVERLRHLGVTTSVYVVDNASIDDTAAIARACGATVLSEQTPGKGNAIRHGFAALPADIDLVAMLDGDDTYEPLELPRMIEPLLADFADVVVGSRLAGRMADRSMRFVSRLGNWLFTFLVRIVYRANVSDVLSGYFAFTRSALDDLVPHLGARGFEIEMEMIVKLARLGHPITSVPISYAPRRGLSSLHPLRDGLVILGTFLRLLRWRPAPVTARVPRSPHDEGGPLASVSA